MIFLFKLIIITSIWVLGLTIATQKGMILYWMREGLTDENGEATMKVFDPMLVCHWCMPSLHTLIGFMLAYGIGVITIWDWSLLIYYPLVVMGSSVTVGITWEFYKTLEAIRKYYIKSEQLKHFDVTDRIKRFNQTKTTQHGSK